MNANRRSRKSLARSESSKSMGAGRYPKRVPASGARARGAYVYVRDRDRLTGHGNDGGSTVASCTTGGADAGIAVLTAGARFRLLRTAADGGRPSAGSGGGSTVRRRDTDALYQRQLPAGTRCFAVGTYGWHRGRRPDRPAASPGRRSPFGDRRTQGNLEPVVDLLRGGQDLHGRLDWRRRRGPIVNGSPGAVRSAPIPLNAISAHRHPYCVAVGGQLYEGGGAVPVRTGRQGPCRRSEGLADVGLHDGQQCYG